MIPIFNGGYVFIYALSNTDEIIYDELVNILQNER